VPAHAAFAPNAELVRGAAESKMPSLQAVPGSNL